MIYDNRIKEFVENHIAELNDIASELSLAGVKTPFTVHTAACDITFNYSIDTE